MHKPRFFILVPMVVFFTMLFLFFGSPLSLRSTPDSVCTSSYQREENKSITHKRTENKEFSVADSLPADFGTFEPFESTKNAFTEAQNSSDSKNNNITPETKKTENFKSPENHDEFYCIDNKKETKQKDYYETCEESYQIKEEDETKNNKIDDNKKNKQDLPIEKIIEEENSHQEEENSHQ